MEKIHFNDNLDIATGDDLIQKFINRKKALNLSTETIIYYENCYKYFCEYYNAKLPVSKITKDTYYGYISHLQASKPDVSTVTLNSYLRGIRAILYFGMEENLIKKFNITLLKQEKKIKETYTDSDLEYLLKKPNTKKCDFIEYRNWVIINYLLATR